jgi:hypothetical protein
MAGVREARCVEHLNGTSSPVEVVLSHGMGDHCGHCLLCGAYSDDVAEVTAWMWLSEHVCGVETVRPARSG